MILVTVGTHNAGFDRLVRAMDMLAAELTEEVIIQYGSSTYIPQHATAFQWGTSEQMMELTRQARVIVSHAAAGVILQSMNERKPLVVVPRLKVYREHMDDHQVQLAEALAKAGRVIAVHPLDVDALRSGIELATSLSVSISSPAALNQALKVKLSEWDGP